MSEPCAMTVLGPVPARELGKVMMHEHLLHDDRDEPFWFSPGEGEEGRRLAEVPVTMDILGYLWRSPHVNRENNRFTRRDPMVDELGRYRAAGGGTIVELTTHGLTPDHEGLVDISRTAGVHVVAGCGHYVHRSHVPEVEASSVEQLAEDMVRSIRTGFGETGVCAGIIGEIGVSAPMSQREEKVLRAAGQAAADTGAAVMVHLEMTHEQAFPAFDVLTSEGVAPDRIVMNHMDEAKDVEYSIRVAGLGCGVQYDTFGSEWYFDAWNTREPLDTERVAAVARLCREGFSEQITLSEDVFWKQHLRAFGGVGFDHLLRTVVPMLREAGVTEDQLDQMLVETPRRLLTLPGVSAG